MTRLRKMMLEELQRRNYSAITTRNYLRVVADFAKFFGKSPDKLGLNELRTYQAYLLRERKLTPGTVVNQVAALGFFFVKTLKRHQWNRRLREFPPSSQVKTVYAVVQSPLSYTPERVTPKERPLGLPLASPTPTRVFISKNATPFQEVACPLVLNGRVRVWNEGNRRDDARLLSRPTRLTVDEAEIVMILITGASGNVGREVVMQALTLGLTIRASSDRLA